MWNRDLDVLVPLWQGAADIRVRDGATALSDLVPPQGKRVAVAVPAGPSDEQQGVLHLAAVILARRAQEEVLARHRPQRLLTLGGDCAVEVASVAHLAGEHGQRLFVLWIDAHGDLNTPATSPSGTAHGMPLRLLLDRDADGPLDPPGCLTPRQVAMVGTRDLDQAEADYLSLHGIEVLDVASLIDQPGRLAELPPAGAAVYAHLDLDVLDPSVLPAVAVPTALGVSLPALVQGLSALHARHDVVGIGITEYVPKLDHDRQAVVTLLAALGLTAVAGSTAKQT